VSLIWRPAAPMYLFGYSPRQSLRFMALTIAVGFVVDDAIVMIEKHHGGTSRGRRAASWFAAVPRGARAKSTFTIISMTVSLIAVFHSTAPHGRDARPLIPRICSDGSP